MAQENDNFKAGLFVLAGILLLIVVIVTLTDITRLFQGSQIVQVRFDLSDGLKGLVEGAAVTIGDQPVGAVRTISDVTETMADGSERVVAKLVGFTIPARYHIYQNAEVELKAPFIGSDTKLNVRSVGSGSRYDSQLSPPLVGGIAPNLQMQELVQNLGIQDLQRQQIQQIIANIEQITSTGRELMQRAEPLADKAGTTVDDVHATVSDVRTMVGNVKQRTDVWFERIDAVSAAARQAVESIRGIISDKEPAVRETVDNVRDITKTVRERTLVQVNESMDKAAKVIEDVRVSVEQAKKITVTQGPVIERILANLNLTAAQLKLASVEIRRSPWRLLYQPGDKELETDNLYDAARSFASAAEALDMTARSLQSLVENAKDQPEQVRTALDYLEKMLSQFQQAERQFWDELNKQR